MFVQCKGRATKKGGFATALTTGLQVTESETPERVATVVIERQVRLQAAPANLLVLDMEFAQDLLIIDANVRQDEVGQTVH